MEIQPTVDILITCEGFLFQPVVSYSMRSFRVMVVVVLVLTSLTAVPLIGAPTAQAPSSPVSAPGTQSSPSGSPGIIKRPIDNTTSYLAINESWINTTRINTIIHDAGGVVVIGTQKIVRTVSTNQFDAAIQNASDERVVIDAALDRAANRTDELRARQTSAIEAYNDGELSRQAFLRELAIIGKKATQLRTYVESVSRKIRLLDGESRSIRNRVSYLKRELNTLTGPVRTRIRSSLQGDPSAPQRYFVRTSDHGVVLATVGEDKYVREVYLTGARTVPNATGFTSLKQARNFVEESYPVAKNWSEPTSEVAYEKNGLYWFKYESYSDTKLIIGVDKSSGKVFHEEQVKLLIDDGTIAGPTDKSEHYALTTRLTHPGGYMRILLTNRTNGDEINGTISINNETISVTGTDGKLYILQPDNLTTINATVNGETLSVTIGQTSQAPPTHPEPGPGSDSTFDFVSGHDFRAKAKDVRG